MSVGFDRTLRTVRIGGGSAQQRVLIRRVAEIPLDVEVRSDEQSFPGTIWVADYGSGRIMVVDPVGGAGWLERLKEWPRWVLWRFAEYAAPPMLGR